MECPIADFQAIGKFATNFKSNLLAPVCRRLLRDELNIEEGPLPGSIVVPCRGPSNDPGRHIGDNVLVKGEGLGDDESPSGLEAASDHGPGGGRWGGGEAKRIGELEAADLEGK